MPKIVHFEIPVDDPQRAVAFYHGTLGWDVSGYGEEHSPVLIAGVAGIGDVLRRVRTYGGEVVQGRLPIPGMGWSAYIRDSEGNTLGFFQPDMGAAAAS